MRYIFGGNMNKIADTAIRYVTFGLWNVGRYTGMGERVVPRLCELAPTHGQRESGCGIHAT